MMGSRLLPFSLVVEREFRTLSPLSSLLHADIMHRDARKFSHFDGNSRLPVISFRNLALGKTCKVAFAGVAARGDVQLRGASAHGVRTHVAVLSRYHGAERGWRRSREEQWKLPARFRVATCDFQFLLFERVLDSWVTLPTCEGCCRAPPVAKLDCEVLARRYQEARPRMSSFADRPLRFDLYWL